MKSLFAAAATVALVAGAGIASAQMYQQPMMPPPAYQQPMPEAQSTPMQQPTTISGTPSWMQDDGSSSDYPIHNPGDVSGNRLNGRYQGGMITTPGNGFPAQWDDER
jgi:hypothetical protein